LAYSSAGHFMPWRPMLMRPALPFGVDDHALAEFGMNLQTC